MSFDKPKKKSFITGPIPAIFISEAIAKHQSKTTIGAHSIFLGQVRADLIDGKAVAAIDYSAYEEMADKCFHDIREAAFAKYELSCLHLYHSLGLVKTGEVCLFVFVSAPHRKVVFQAVEFLVEEIKSKVPIYGKEMFKDETYTWKKHT
ncbi:MAG: molybdenum cofactor biosynthesis protein MoaE [Burkholderiales bacterium]|nr:molybdenum cofactor biosynthesis protein MoaE [Flavobacterium sp.]